jgi:hypothetical protein
MTMPMGPPGPDPMMAAERNARSRLGAAGAGKRGAPSPDEGLVDMKTARYVDPAPADDVQCARCANFMGPDACSKVAGTISPSGTCDLFEAMPTPTGTPTEDLAPGGPAAGALPTTR